MFFLLFLNNIKKLEILFIVSLHGIYTFMEKLFFFNRDDEKQDKEPLPVSEKSEPRLIFYLYYLVLFKNHFISSSFFDKNKNILLIYDLSLTEEKSYK